MTELQVRQVLPGIIDIGTAGAVARGNVKVSIGSDDRLAAVVASGRPLDDDHFRFGTQARRVATWLQLISRYAALLFDSRGSFMSA